MISRRMIDPKDAAAIGEFLKRAPRLRDRTIQFTLTMPHTTKLLPSKRLSAERREALRNKLVALATPRK